MMVLADGYYWARHAEGTLFVVLREWGAWWTIGLGHPIDLDARQVVCPVTPPLN